MDVKDVNCRTASIVQMIQKVALFVPFTTTEKKSKKKEDHLDAENADSAAWSVKMEINA